MSEKVQKILVKFPVDFIGTLESVGKEHQLMHRYGGEERVALAQVVEYLCSTHPEVREE